MKYIEYVNSIVCLCLLTVISGCTANQIGRLALPEQFVLASTPNQTGAAVETRISKNGRLWSGPNTPRDSNRASIPAFLGIPAGIGANKEEYLLAFFDKNEILHTQTSTNGLDWRNDKTYGHADIGIRSRPSVAYDYTSNSWFAAYRQADRKIVIRQLVPSSRNITINNATTSFDIGFAIANRQFVLAYNASGKIRVLTSQDGKRWPTSSGVLATVANIPVESHGGPFLANNLGGFSMALSGTTPLNPPSLSQGFINTYESTNGINWTSKQHLGFASPLNAVGPAIAGISTNTMVAEHNGSQKTDIWLENRPARPIKALETRSPYSVSLAFGPKGQVVAKKIELTFTRFKYGGNQNTRPFSGNHDVKLNVSHLSISGNILKRMPEWELKNIPKNQSSHWTNAAGNLPKFLAYMQPGEKIRIDIKDNDGVIYKVLTFAELNSNASGRQFTASNPPGSSTLPYAMFHNRRVTVP